jgi:hypothetical protein
VKPSLSTNSCLVVSRKMSKKGLSLSGSRTYKLLTSINRTNALASPDFCKKMIRTTTMPSYAVILCASALLDLLGKKKNWWYVCRQHALNNTVPSHPSKVKTPNNKRKWNEVYHDALKDHFEQLKKEVEPTASGVKRDINGETTLQYDVDYLPPNVSKRSCYGRFCLERG